jgi:hypothetical protein
VYDTKPDYEVLGRCYERSDGTRILVLVKLMASGNEGEDPDTIYLPGYYKRVLGPGGALSQAANFVTLTNNDGAILVESEEPGGGGGGKVDPGQD